jgi:hypothetical protein
MARKKTLLFKGHYVVTESQTGKRSAAWTVTVDAPRPGENDIYLKHEEQLDGLKLTLHRRDGECHWAVPYQPPTLRKVVLSSRHLHRWFDSPQANTDARPAAVILVPYQCLYPRGPVKHKQDVYEAGPHLGPGWLMEISLFIGHQACELDRAFSVAGFPGDASGRTHGGTSVWMTNGERLWVVFARQVLKPETAEHLEDVRQSALARGFMPNSAIPASGYDSSRNLLWLTDLVL